MQFVSLIEPAGTAADRGIGIPAVSTDRQRLAIDELQKFCLIAWVEPGEDLPQELSRVVLLLTVDSFETDAARYGEAERHANSRNDMPNKPDDL